MLFDRSSCLFVRKFGPHRGLRMPDGKVLLDCTSNHKQGNCAVNEDEYELYKLWKPEKDHLVLLQNTFLEDYVILPAGSPIIEQARSFKSDFEGDNLFIVDIIDAKAKIKQQNLFDNEPKAVRFGLDKFGFCWEDNHKFQTLVNNKSVTHPEYALVIFQGQYWTEKRD